MNYKANGAIALLIFVLGVLVLVYDNPTINRAVLIFCGIAFFLPGLLSVLGAFFSGRGAASKEGKDGKANDARAPKAGRSSFSRAISLVCGFAGIGLGVCIWLLPDIFQPVIVWLFAGLLIIGGVYQLWQLSSGKREVAFPGWLIIGPVVTVAAGVVLVCVPYFHLYGPGFERNEFWMMLVTGVGMLLFGVVGVIIACLVGGYRHKERKAAKAVAKAEKEAASKVSETKADNDGAAAVNVGEGTVDGKLAAALKLTDDAEEKPVGDAPAE